MQNYLIVGQIINTHGVKGEVRILPLTDDERRFSKLKRVFVELGDELRELAVKGVKYSRGQVILKFEGIDTIDSAEVYKGCYMKIRRENAIKLSRDTYFISDIIGCRVCDESGSILGVVSDVLKTGSNDVYVVTRENKKELLIPALKSVVKDVSVADEKIIVSLPEGLADDEI